MNYILQHYVLKKKVPYEPIVKGNLDIPFEDLVQQKIDEYIGFSDERLSEIFDIPYKESFNKKGEKIPNKALWSTIVYRILGIRSNRAEEFVKANIVIKTIRLEEDNTIEQSMSFPTFEFKDLAKEEEWEESELYEYLNETRFLFVVFKKHGNNYILHSNFFWYAGATLLDGEIKRVWQNARDVVREGVILTKKRRGSGYVFENNLPGLAYSPICHVRPHAGKSGYQLETGEVFGNLKYSSELPDGRRMTTQCFWLNNTFIAMLVKKHGK